MTMLVRCMAATLITAGWSCLVLALEVAGTAADCEPADFSPATCVAAHEVPRDSSTPSGSCEVNEDGLCVAIEGESCGGDTGFGYVIAGRCQSQPASSNPYICTQDYGITIVVLHRWVQRCEFKDGDCTCVVEADEGGEAANVEVCDCKDEEV